MRSLPGLITASQREPDGGAGLLRSLPGWVPGHNQRLRLLFAGHDCQTAGYAKLSGLKNGELLTAAEAGGFEVLVTTDQDIPYQQNLATRRISIVILCAPTNRLTSRFSPIS